jgi:hypothetical protein
MLLLYIASIGLLAKAIESSAVQLVIEQICKRVADY